MCCFDLPQYDDICRRASNRHVGWRTRSRRNVHHNHHPALSQSIFIIPGNSRLVRSGFPYHESLIPAQVNLSDWLQFSAAIASCVQQTSKDRLEALICGLISGSTLLLMIGPFSLLAGISAARSCARAKEQEKILQSVQMDQALCQVLREWNNTYFLPRGLIVRLDVPDDGHDNDFKQLWNDISCGRLQRCDDMFNSCNFVTKEENTFVLWVRDLIKPRLVVTRVHSQILD